MFRKQSNSQIKHSNKLWFILLTLSLIFCSVLHSFVSTQVSLEWNPNNEPDLAGYRVFYREEGKSYDYTNPIWEGANTYCTIYNIDETKNCYFVTRAFDTKGFESGDSNEVCLESISVAALSSLYIIGDSLVNENSSASYTATATFSDRSRRIVTSSVAWSENSSYAGINSSGVLIAPEVTEDTSVTIQASYSIGGVTKTATKVVTIIDVTTSNLHPDTPNMCILKITPAMSRSLWI